jgi:broad specificity phosphatase PhoE
VAPLAPAGAPPQQIYVIRHGEKPGASKHQDLGVDADGSHDVHALTPRGWQRSGALAVLFAPAAGPLRGGLRRPTALYAPDYGSPAATRGHRTYQTVEGLAGVLGLPINTLCAQGKSAELAAAALANTSDVVLICWDHTHIPAIGTALPTLPDTRLPAWPDDRFDMIWSFTWRATASPAAYEFSQVPQRLLAGDGDAFF